jgi:hypothetical protein
MASTVVKVPLGYTMLLSPVPFRIDQQIHKKSPFGITERALTC